MEREWVLRSDVAKKTEEYTADQKRRVTPVPPCTVRLAEEKAESDCDVIEAETTEPEATEGVEGRMKEDIGRTEPERCERRLQRRCARGQTKEGNVVAEWY
jgi:hypothetical protein